jgi:rod shape determining protein RodA
MVITQQLRRLDYLLIAVAILLAAYGIMLIHSAALTNYDGPAISWSNPVTKQVFFAIAGVLLMLGIARIDYRRILAFKWPLYFLSLFLLLAVLVVGVEINGSTRWFQVGGILVQPSEAAKLATILVVAKFLEERGGEIQRLPVLLMSLAIAAVPAFLVFIEPDLGTAIVFGCAWLVMVVTAGARWFHLGLLAASLVVIIPFASLTLVTDYQAERVALFVDPERDPLGSGFNVRQAEISVGSGGLFGKGYMDGSQTQLDYLRTQETDYIFSVLGEELGFAGAVALFLLLGVLLFRGIRTASRSRDMAGRYIAIGIVGMILFQAFINIGVNIRLFPVTGIPLPFISAGGSSLVSMFISLGVLQSINVRSQRTYGTFSR